MADRTSQPPSGTGVNSIYTGARFLWNAVDPNVNALDASTGSGAKGTSTAGADGTYQRYNNTDGATTFSITVPTGAYTLVLVLAYPAASQGGGGGQPIFSTPGGGVRNETYTTGGGVYQVPIHTGVAAANTIVTSVSGFDSEAWTYVVRYDGTSIYQYQKQPDGTETTNSQTIGYSVGSATSVALGSPNSGATGGGLYAVLLVNGDLGDVEANALLDNPWRMFAPEAGAGSTNGMAFGSRGGRALNAGKTFVGGIRRAALDRAHQVGDRIAAAVQRERINLGEQLLAGINT